MANTNETVAMKTLTACAIPECCCLAALDAKQERIAELEAALAVKEAEIARITKLRDEAALAWTRLTDSQEQEIEALRGALDEELHRGRT